MAATDLPPMAAAPGAWQCACPNPVYRSAREPHSILAARNRAYHFVTHPIVAIIVQLTVIVSVVSLALQPPGGGARSDVFVGIEATVAAVFTLEFVVKIFAISAYREEVRPRHATLLGSKRRLQLDHGSAEEPKLPIDDVRSREGYFQNAWDILDFIVLIVTVR